LLYGRAAPQKIEDAREINMDIAETATDTKFCRYCYQSIHPAASKCSHCHELLATHSRIEIAGKKIIALVGIGTALLSLLYGVKEGYYYIEQQRQEREMFADYMVAAENFITLDNLQYAEISLNDALKLNPHDKQLRLKIFLLGSHRILREQDYYGAQLTNQTQKHVPDLIIEGFSLIDDKFPLDKQARLLSHLARLLQIDQMWQRPDAIDDLFSRSLALAVDDAEIIYWYGDRLLNSEDSKQRGLSFIQKAAKLDPDNAIYITAMGRYQRKSGDYPAAFASFRRAIELKSRQKDLQRIRASNLASSYLKRAVKDADNKFDISGDQFHGLSLQQRIELIEFTLDKASGDRKIKFLAARLFHSVQKDARAENLLRDAMGRIDKFTDTRQLELLATVLESQGKPEAVKFRTLLAKMK